ncbi:MAG TPA: hypothetical protein VN914_13680 [Polyangia bacterium]|nr:hypothetical protein [Polyangia bacterium]
MSLPILAFATAQAQPPAPTTPAPAPAPAAAPKTAPTPRGRVAIRELVVEGEETSPALGMQLQDGFVVGFVRAGIQVLDSVDVARKVEGHPELQKCDTPICLKRLGQLLDVRYLLLLKVTVNGNSYRMTARLFSTEGSTPAVLPVDTQSRFCDVCTVAEAREVMLRLADAIKRPIEEALAAATPPPAAPPPNPSMVPVVGLGAGLLGVVGGALLIVTADSNDKTLPALGGALIGGGATIVGVSIHAMATDPARVGKKPAVGVTLAVRW